VVEKSVGFKSNIVNVAKPAVSFCGCQASNREVDTDDLIDFVKEVTACAADFIVSCNNFIVTDVLSLMVYTTATG